MDGLVLADIPELSSERNPRSQITVARLGHYSDPRYGKFEIGEADYDGWKHNLAATFGGRVSVDFDHSSDRGRGTEAAAWITGLERNGDDVIADVEWTPKGAAAVRDKAYQFISPTFTEHYKDEHGVDRGRALLGAACTNRPVLRQLPTLSLSADPIADVATPSDPDSAAARERTRARALASERLRANPAPARDSREHMDPAELLKLLDLPEDADEATILAKVTELKAAPAAPAEPAPAAPAPAAPAPDGTLTLSAERVADLEARANAGAAAAVALAEQTFTLAWEKALSEGRAAPSQEENLRELHKTSPELAIKTLDSFVAIVPVKPAGSGDGAHVGPAPLGMEDERYALHTEAKALAAKKLSEDPKLDAGDAYALAAIEIEERKFTLENPGI